MPQPMDKVYDPQQVEQEQYDYWMQQGVFEAEVRPDQPPYCIVIPPPNVTGVLHMGHALDETIQDLLIRRARMRGHEALWLPGTDHAGIATQNVMEARLAAEGLTRHDLGREAFVERVWQLKDQHHSHIVAQLKRFGSSLDWRRERFTLDEGLSRAVREAFVTLHEQGLIYRGARMINWCPRCHTGLSDLEVEHEDTSGHLWYLRYPDPQGGPGLVVATTRPETMLGDTGVAVHPGDPRYTHLVGRSVVLPLLEREIPVVADEQVDPEFGTGAVKVTPAHDPNDAQIAQRQGLPAVVVIGLDGKMTEAAGPYQGLERYDCRRQVIADLEERGLLERIEPHSHAVGQCQRCDTVVEPLMSTQWFVRMEPLAREGLRAVDEGRVRFIPARWERVYRDWLENTTDWCISRQLWWGHPIPVWYCSDCGEQVCSRHDPESCPNCGSADLEQDPDVLDTWFSSALWPLSTLGWPEETPELGYFYPTSVLVTGYDIIYFWVARMIMMGMHLRGQEPFREVFIHGLVRDEQGRKMSKSLGNAVDPLLLIDQYGADALRFALVQLITHGQDLTYTPDRLVGARNFCNKLWNASRLVLANLGDEPAAAPASEALGSVDRWILSRHQRMLQTVNRELDRQNLSQAAEALYDYFWGDLCDWYLEIAKLDLYAEGEPQRLQAVRGLLRKLLGGVLRALHPLMPFITEAIWRRLEPAAGSLAVQAYPQADESLLDPEAEAQVEQLQAVVIAIRRLRAGVGLPPQQRMEVSLVAEAEPLRRAREQAAAIGLLAGAGPLNLREPGGAPPTGTIATVAGPVQVHLHLAEVDIAAELERVARKIREVTEGIARGERKLQDGRFLERAPHAVVDGERERLAGLQDELGRLEEVRRALEEAAE